MVKVKCHNPESDLLDFILLVLFQVVWSNNNIVIDGSYPKGLYNGIPCDGVCHLVWWPYASLWCYHPTAAQTSSMRNDTVACMRNDIWGTLVASESHIRLQRGPQAWETTSSGTPLIKSSMRNDIYVEDTGCNHIRLQRGPRNDIQCGPQQYLVHTTSHIQL